MTEPSRFSLNLFLPDLSHRPNTQSCEAVMMRRQRPRRILVGSSAFLLVPLSFICICCGPNAAFLASNEVIPAQEACTIHVANRNFRDVDVSLLVSGSYVRLERILAGDSKRIAVSPDIAGERPRMLVRHVGSSRWFATNDAPCGPGQELELWVAGDLYETTLLRFR